MEFKTFIHFILVNFFSKQTILNVELTDKNQLNLKMCLKNNSTLNVSKINCI